MGSDKYVCSLYTRALARAHTHSCGFTKRTRSALLAGPFPGRPFLPFRYHADLFQSAHDSPTEIAENKDRQSRGKEVASLCGKRSQRPCSRRTALFGACQGTSAQLRGECGARLRRVERHVVRELLPQAVRLLRSWQSPATPRLDTDKCVQSALCPCRPARDNRAGLAGQPVLLLCIRPMIRPHLPQRSSMFFLAEQVLGSVGRGWSPISDGNKPERQGLLRRPKGHSHEGLPLLCVWRVHVRAALPVLPCGTGSQRAWNDP